MIDHRGLFIYINPGYPGSFHDVNCLRQSDLYKHWRRFFTHHDDYFEFLLGDPGYVGEEMFIMRRLGRREIPEDGNVEVIDPFNAMHPGYRVRVADALLTNFHLPRSSLLILVSAFAGRDLILRAYRHAVAERYRFYSYGDCMLIL